ncbi:MAG: hypothetical protein NT094_00320 [Candidatus Staskawiczbacteria bacterium]|nr:hypothetical protein [Candidatus Staskawiczbacteria bacterium]
MSSLNRGNILRVSEITNKKYIDSTKEDFPISNTGAKFIQVTVAAQNMGTINTKKNVWDIGNIIDSEGRNFIPSESGIISRWLPEDNSCGDLLKPAFDPVSCTKIYEVSKESIGLKITIEYNEGSNKDSSFLDLIVK